VEEEELAPEAGVLTRPVGRYTHTSITCSPPSPWVLGLPGARRSTPMSGLGPWDMTLELGSAQPLGEGEVGLGQAGDGAQHEQTFQHPRRHLPHTPL
jgi:hypothetical protein